MTEQSSSVTFADLIQRGILEIGDGYRAKNSELGGDGPIFLRAGRLTQGGWNWEGAERFHADLTAKVNSKLAQSGDTVITTKGNSTGRTGYVPDDAPIFVYSPHLSYWRSKNVDELDARYLRYWSLSSDFHSQLKSMAHGTDMAPYLSLGDQKRLKITLPSLGRQRSIGEVLGALDDKIAANERAASTADTLADYIFEKCTSELKRVPMSQLLTPVLGGTPDRKIDSYWGPGIPWASARDVANATVGVIAQTDEQITQEAVGGTRAKPLPSGSVILTARGTVGVVARVMHATAINQSCYAFRPGKIPAAILFHLIRCGSRNMLSVAHGTVFSTVNMKTFDHIEIPAISDDLSAALESRLAPLHRLVEARVEESRILASLRDTLLPQLMSGETRVREAERIVEGAV
ncbi:restriction endonuclease subunit S [Streptomyces sp. H39-C1]|uniref:restriction endonuclease subunit S n=1 Tax=Streptomyces sp. H39-C1 TaxID=3004355 RepID=UPI0022AF020A|nr:restriction endonuclease subunit S [Streptomyces sp. H39-C1]MCZ4103422.1 restriction endonuclease subunit S [Streptomyces sp. H39-C1]